jgi:hypothetical protein
VNRQNLIEDLVRAGVSAQIVQLFRQLYMGDTFRLLLDRVTGSVIFCVVKAVHEGSCLSPILFILFIRELPFCLNNLSLWCLVIGGLCISSLFFADDLTLLAYTVSDTQTLVEVLEAFFGEKDLRPNPAKCEFLVFNGVQTRRVAGPKATWRVWNITREQQDSAQYLGLHFEVNGRWDLQLQVVTTKARSALGRCKIVVKTAGTGNLKLFLNYFDLLVSSVYRFGLGAWGVTAPKVGSLDKIFQ